MLKISQLVNFRAFSAAVAALLLGLAPVAGHAQQAWPSRAVRLVVPFPPGGATDIIARLVADGLSKSWGQSMVVDNVGGASGTIGSDRVAKAPADGYTVLMGTLASNVVAHFVFAKLPYTPEALAPAVLLTTTPNLLLVNNTVPGTLKELIEYAKANKGKVSYSSPGVGLSGHLGMEMFAGAAGVELLHVPFRGSGPAIQAFAAGQVNLILDLLPSSIGYIKSGTAKPLAIAASKRSAQLPNVPTFAELGVAGVEAYTWNGLMVPAGTPRDVVDRIARDASAALKQPELRDKLLGMGADPIGGTPEEFARMMKGEMDRWGPVIRRAGVKADQ